MLTRVRLSLVLCVCALAASSCNGPNGPDPVLAFTVTASPNPIVGALCTGCGAGSTDREVLTTLTLRETGGREGNLTSLGMSVRVTATGAVIAQADLNAAALQGSGPTRLPAGGTLVLPIGMHYAGSNQGQAATLTVTLGVTDSRGTVTTQTITIAVTT